MLPADVQAWELEFSDSVAEGPGGLGLSSRVVASVLVADLLPVQVLEAFLADLVVVAIVVPE